MLKCQVLQITLSLSTASTASLAKCSLSCERILELKVVMPIFIKSDLNFSAQYDVTQMRHKDHVKYTKHQESTAIAPTLETNFHISSPIYKNPLAKIFTGYEKRFNR